MRNAIFANVAQRAIRRVARETFDHLQNTSCELIDARELEPGRQPGLHPDCTALRRIVSGAVVLVPPLARRREFDLRPLLG